MAAVPAARSITPPRLASRARAGTWLLGVLVPLVFVSGASGLVYQVLWVRLLSLTFGVTTGAVTTVLAGFMAGLALGSYVAGRAADRVRHPLVVYGAVELGIGAMGLLTPRAFAALPRVYEWLPADLDGGPDRLSTLVRLRLAFAIVLAPTTLMGATLPLVVKSSLLRAHHLHQAVGVLYAANTFGAILGTVAAGFVLIGSYGLLATAATAAAGNLLAGALALALAARVRPAVPPPLPAVAPTAAPAAPAAAARAALEPPRRLVIGVAWVYALAGFGSLAYEVAWTRLLALFFDGTTYPFTVMLATVLAGIAVGSYAISPALARPLNWGLVFAALEMALGLSAIGGLWGFGYLHDIAGWVEANASGLPLATADLVALAVSLSTIFPPAVLMGCTFPVAARLYATREGRAGRQVGTIYAANVCGAIFGSYAAGFVLIPRLGAQQTVVTLAALNLLLAVILLGLVPRPAWWRRLALGLAVAPALVLLARAAPDLRTRLLPERAPGAALVWHAEDAEATVSVVDVPAAGRFLYLNSRPQAHDADGPVRLHRLLGHFPMLLHPAPRDVLVVGLGGGATPGAVAEYPGVRVDVVELVPNVIAAARFFDHVNGRVVAQPGIRILVDDGRNYLLQAAHAGRRYDVITADIIRPHHAGAANLYSLEYYRLAAAVLRDDGVMMQWLDPGPMHRHQLMLRTFLAVFPHATLWLNGDLLVGSKRPLAIDEAALARRVAAAGVSRAALADAGIGDDPVLLQWFLARDAELRAYAGDGPVLTDDRPAIEYFRSLPPDATPLDLGRFSRRR